VVPLTEKVRLGHFPERAETVPLTCNVVAGGGVGVGVGAGVGVGVGAGVGVGVGAGVGVGVGVGVGAGVGVGVGVGAGVGVGVGVGAGVGAGAAVWTRVYPCPPIARCAVRSPDGFDATVKVTVPLALPFAPDATATHPLSLDAVQLQPVSVVMPTTSVPPL